MAMTMTKRDLALVDEAAKGGVQMGWDEAVKYIAKMAGQAADEIAHSGLQLTGPQALRRFATAIGVFRLGDAHLSPETDAKVEG